MKKEQIEKKAIELVMKEKTQWENATAFVTEKVAFNMRNMIRQFRKNYWGIFDQPKDPTTGLTKTWIPLTESLVESVVKNLTILERQILYKSKNSKATKGLASLVRSIMKNELDAADADTALRELVRVTAIDGTAVWRTESSYDKFLKRQVIKPINVDLLNFYIEPTAHSIQEADAVVERVLMTTDEVKSNKDWLNTDKAEGTVNVNRNDADRLAGESRTIPLVEVFYYYGKGPKSLMTGKDEDTDLIDVHLVVSGGNESWNTHLIKEYSGIKPYEEAWYTRVPGRWYGRGIAEKVMFLQSWINTIVNIRKVRATVSQLGIFKIRRGSGITPQTMSRLAANGAITVQTMGDIEQMVMQDASPASYRDEENAMGWARQVTSAFEAVTGESMPSSMPATNAAISSRSAGSQFVLIKDGFKSFIEKWIERHAMPLTFKNLKRNTVIWYYPEKLEAYDQEIVDQMVYEQMEGIHYSGQFIDPLQVQEERQRAYAQLQSSGEQRFVEIIDIPKIVDYSVEVSIANGDQDEGVMTQNLISMLQAAPEYKEPIIAEIMDIMGIGPFKAAVQPPVQTPPVGVGQQNPQEVMTQANTGEAFGKAQALSSQ